MTPFEDHLDHIALKPAGPPPAAFLASIQARNRARRLRAASALAVLLFAGITGAVLLTRPPAPSHTSPNETPAYQLAAANYSAMALARIDPDRLRTPNHWAGPAIFARPIDALRPQTAELWNEGPRSGSH
jgi:hypothetical protein